MNRDFNQANICHIDYQINSRGASKSNMRLLHTATLQMSEFFAGSAIPNSDISQLKGSESQSRNIPEYAILSHVWGSDEVSFQDMISDRVLAMKKTAWEKIQESCKQAQRDGYKYIWIDTCCIDKTSSTELSEAINSMFQWYKESAICYVYLSDVDTDDIFNHDEADPILRQELRSMFGKESLFRSTLQNYSRWFSRGWTLQELLAPLRVQFFDQHWKYIGRKEDHLQILSNITNIDLYALNGGDPQRLSIARRMSWAANRQTTRAEDMAYCLLGIFNINMPLLYGEGSKAFIRLQEEILKVSDDQSLFAWRNPAMNHYRDDYPEASKPQGLLAASPDVFEFSNTIAQFYTETPGRAFSSFTNKGLQVEFLMCQDLACPSGLVYLAVLSCQIGSMPGILPAIRLRRMTPNSDQYARIDMSQLLEMCSLNSRSRFNFQGFDPTKSQDQLTEMHLSKPVFPSIYSNAFNILTLSGIRNSLSGLDSSIRIHKTGAAVSFTPWILAGTPEPVFLSVYGCLRNASRTSLGRENSSYTTPA